MGWRGSPMIVAAAAGAALLGAAAAWAQAEGVPPGDEDAGAELYAAQCKGCHTVSIAPSLRGVADRSIGSEAEFHGYSDALKGRSAETWTVANLDAFLKSPPTFAPGTRMVMSVSDAQARADIIAYIRSLPPKR
ncbi:MAG: c-type cytochrome [Pseudomonadota bacterium]